MSYSNLFRLYGFLVNLTVLTVLGNGRSSMAMNLGHFWAGGVSTVSRRNTQMNRCKTRTCCRARLAQKYSNRWVKPKDSISLKLWLDSSGWVCFFIQCLHIFLKFFCFLITFFIFYNLFYSQSNTLKFNKNRNYAFKNLKKSLFFFLILE